MSAPELVTQPPPSAAALPPQIGACNGIGESTRTEIMTLTARSPFVGCCGPQLFQLMTGRGLPDFSGDPACRRIASTFSSGAELLTCASPKLLRARMIDVSAGGVNARAVISRGFLLAIGALRAVFLSQANRSGGSWLRLPETVGAPHRCRRPAVLARPAAAWLRWSEVLVFVKPETVIRWHRQGFRAFWTWKSRRRRVLLRGLT